MAKSLVDLYRAEYEFVSETLMPFLSAYWETLDLVDPNSSKRDGRLTADELLIAHQQALLEDRWSDAFPLKHFWSAMHPCAEPMTTVTPSRMQLFLGFQSLILNNTPK